MFELRQLAREAHKRVSLAAIECACCELQDHVFASEEASCADQSSLSHMCNVCNQHVHVSCNSCICVCAVESALQLKDRPTLADIVHLDLPAQLLMIKALWHVTAHTTDYSAHAHGQRTNATGARQMCKSRLDVVLAGCALVHVPANMST